MDAKGTTRLSQEIIEMNISKHNKNNEEPRNSKYNVSKSFNKEAFSKLNNDKMLNRY